MPITKKYLKPSLLSFLNYKPNTGVPISRTDATYMLSKIPKIILGTSKDLRLVGVKIKSKNPGLFVVNYRNRKPKVINYVPTDLEIELEKGHNKFMNLYNNYLLKLEEPATHVGEIGSAAGLATAATGIGAPEGAVLSAMSWAPRGLLEATKMLARSADRYFNTHNTSYEKNNFLKNQVGSALETAIDLSGASDIKTALQPGMSLAKQAVARGLSKITTNSTKNEIKLLPRIIPKTTIGENIKTFTKPLLNNQHVTNIMYNALKPTFKTTRVGATLLGKDLIHSFNPAYKIPISLETGIFLNSLRNGFNSIKHGVSLSYPILKSRFKDTAIHGLELTYDKSGIYDSFLNTPVVLNINLQASNSINNENYKKYLEK